MQASAFHQFADRRPAQRRDPSQSGVLPEFADLGFGEHAAVAHQHHPGQPEALPHFLHLVGHRGGIAGVAWVHLDGHGAAFSVREQAIDDDRPALLSVPVMAEARQRAGVTFVVTAADVVKDDGSLAQVALGQLALDARLACQQPVHGPVEVVFVAVGDPQFLGQSGGVPGARSGQFGAGMQKAFGDHGHDEVALAAALGRDYAVQAELTDGTEYRLDVSVGQAALDLKGVGGCDEPFARQRAADDLHEFIGKVGDIPEGFVADLGADAEGAAEEVGAVDRILVAAFCSGHMNSTSTRRHGLLYGIQ